MIPWSCSGVRVSRSYAFACAGSPLDCPARHHSGARKAIRWATSAQAAETTPSSTTGSRRTAACSRKPVIAAKSAPPVAPSSASWSPSTGRARRSESRMVAHLTIHTRSSIPEPRPVTAAASVPHSAPTRTPATVVEPTPRSPSSTRSVPASASSSATAMPARNARAVSSGVSASSMSIRPDPRRIRWVTTSSGKSAGSVSTATSTIRTSAP